jgi:hypothetical protein
MLRTKIAWLFLCLTSSPAVLAQGNPYTYVKMSLLVPWTLYFVFLAAVLIPFVVLIIIAWQRKGDDDLADKDQ